MLSDKYADMTGIHASHLPFCYHRADSIPGIFTMRALLLLFCLLIAGPAAAAPAYTVTPLSQLALYPESRTLAQVIPENESRIAAELTARIDAIPVKRGQSVKKGDILVRLDQRQYRLALEQAASQVELLQNRYKLAQLQFEQASKLHQSNFISAQALAQRGTEMAVLGSELKIARQHVAQARLALDKTLLRAPFAGAVKERLASEGELAAPGLPILTLVQQSRNELRAQVPHGDIDQLRAAKQLTFRQAAKTYPVRIVRIAPVLDPQAQTRDVILQADTELPSGLAGELIWRSPTPYLPATYLQRRKQQLGVWIEENGKPLFRPLLQAQAGRPVAVPWPADTRIIDAGRFALDVEPNASASAAQR
jgi:RND family efflux transporter MFP subunit